LNRPPLGTSGPLPRLCLKLFDLLPEKPVLIGQGGVEGLGDDMLVAEAAEPLPGVGQRVESRADAMVAKSARLYEDLARAKGLSV
jgi:hypothetical protein